MAEGDYEYEKMRCELLGLPIPEKTNESCEDEKEIADEEKSTEDLAPVTKEERLDADQELETNNEQMRHMSGGLDELTTILSVTQKKLNKFKVVCGSLTNLLKIKVGTSKNEEGTSSNNDSQVATDNEDEDEAQNADAGDADAGDADAGGGKVVRTAPKSRQTPRQMDTSEMMDSQIDKLDSLIMKAEHAHLSMSSQNKQMKHFLRK